MLSLKGRKGAEFHELTLQYESRGPKQDFHSSGTTTLKPSKIYENLYNVPLSFPDFIIMEINRKSFKYKGVCSLKSIKEKAAKETSLLHSRLGEENRRLKKQINKTERDLLDEYSQ